jgi:drug/metabolite transporter (DMT)-like permease
MSFQIFAWIATLCYGFETVTGKLTNKYKIKNQWQFAFFKSFFAMLIVTPIAFYKVGFALPTNWIDLSLSSLFSVTAGTLIIITISKMDVSVLSPLFNFRAVFSVVLGWFILGELLTLQQYGLIALIVFAGMFVSMDEKFSIRNFFTSDTLIALIMTVFLALFSIYSNRSINTNGYWEHMLWRGIVAQSIFLVMIPLFYKDFVRTKVKDYSGVFAMALFSSFGTMASLKAFEKNVGVTSAIVSLPTSMLIVFILSFLKPDLLEKHPLKVYAIRFTAAGVMLVSALML